MNGADFWMADLTQGGSPSGTVEVIREEVVDPNAIVPVPVYRYTVLCSRPTGVGKLASMVGFSNDPIHCEEMTARGFEFIEARVVLKQAEAPKGIHLYVYAPAFVGPSAPPYEINYEHELLRIGPVEFPSPKEPRVREKRPRGYAQNKFTPDLLSPATMLRRTSVEWSLDRWDVVELKSTVKSYVPPLRWPRTSASGHHDAVTSWMGVILPPPVNTTARTPSESPPLPPRSAIWGKRGHEGAPRRVKHPARYGSSESRFRNLEVLGVRLDIPRFESSGPTASGGMEQQERQEKKLYKLVEPLNFHLPNNDETDLPDCSRPDFHYRPATSSVTLELLRYGRMGIPKELAGMTPHDFQSQHELIVRTVVGRVDEDACQGQEASTFVPAIFVDNTWSKFMGRHFCGLDKRLAYFCVDEGGDEGRRDNGRRPRGEKRTVRPLSPYDAADIRDNPVPLSRIVQVRLAPWTLPESEQGVGEEELLNFVGQPDDLNLLSVEAKMKIVTDVRSRLAKLGPLVYELDCDPETIDGWDDFRPAPTEAILGSSPLGARPFRQDDFEEAEVRRDFARAAGKSVSGSFTAVQATPLLELDDPTTDATSDPGSCGEDGDARLETRAWIYSRYRVIGTSLMARPRGSISIRLYRIRPAVTGANDRRLVAGWNRLCDVLGVPKNEEGEGSKLFTFGAGSWYRIKYDMDLAVEDSFD